jgi:glycerophosphoryl diester phosphodiesterase
MRRFLLGLAFAALISCSHEDAKAPQPAERRCTAGENLEMCGKNLVIAHRGGSDLWPEETLLAFDNATKAGVDVLELDVHATKDGTIVCMHDEKVDRTTDGTGLIKEKTFAEVQALDAAAKFTTDGGKTFPYRGTGVKVATLKEVLEKFPRMPFSVEIKQFSPPIVDAVIGVIEAANMSDKVVIASFDDDTIRAVRAKRPKLATSLALGETLELAKVRTDEDLAGYKPPTLLYQANAGSITEENMRIYNQLGIRVHVWTVNDEDTMRRMWKLGVHGIMTDDPTLLLRVTSELGLTDKGR